MVVLVVLAVVWLAVRVVVGLRMAVRPPERACPADKHSRGRTPQDAPWRPHDASPVGATAPSRNSRAKGRTPTRAPEAGAASFQTAVIDRVSRPDEGPGCFGGRDDTAYLRGWDDAVDWVSKANDAQSPTWGDVAYMTGWSDAVQAIGRARACAIG